MLARHHQGTQKIVISDNIFVTGKKKCSDGETFHGECLMLLRFVSCVTTALLLTFQRLCWGVSLGDFSVKAHHHLFRLEGWKWKYIQIKNGIIVVSLAGLVPAVRVYVVSTLPDKPSPYFLCCHLWPVTKKSMKSGWSWILKSLIAAWRQNFFFFVLFIASRLSVSFQVGHVNSRYLYTGRWRLFMKVGAILIPPVFRYMKNRLMWVQLFLRIGLCWVFGSLIKFFFSPCHVAWYCFIWYFGEEDAL